MDFRIIAAAAASLGLMAACNNPAPAPPKPEETKPVAETPKAPDPAFASAMNFQCAGGPKLDVVMTYQPSPGVLLRADGGATQTLAHDDKDESGMSFKDATTTIKFAGSEFTYIAGGKTKTCQFVPRELDPPAAAGVVRTLKAADKDASVAIKVGEKVAVAIVGVPTAGYQWGVPKPPAFIKASDGGGGPTSTAQMQPGFAGGSHWEVVLIEGVKAGEGEIVLEMRRPWEPPTEPAAESFKFKLKVS